MGNVVGSVLTGFSEVLGKLLGHPLDFLSGKSCNTKCGPTWDFMCYIENFCISQLLKLALVVVLLYFVLLFFYLSYKLGIFQCICHTICRSIWACWVINFSVLESCCTFLCSRLDKHNQRQRRRRAMDIEALATNTEEYDDHDEEEGSFSTPFSRQVSQKRKLQSHQGRDYHYRHEHLRRVLRPKNYRINAGIAEKSLRSKRRKYSKKRHDDRASPADHIRVTRTSKFAQKRGSFKGSHHQHRRMYGG